MLKTGLLGARLARLGRFLLGHGRDAVVSSAEPTELELVGSYVTSLSVVGSYQTSITLAGEHRTSIDLVGEIA